MFIDFSTTIALMSLFNNDHTNNPNQYSTKVVQIVWKKFLLFMVACLHLI